MRIDGLRSIAQAVLFPACGFNWVVGDNGAGKTSVLESLSLLGSGRSFRSGSVDGVIQRGAEACRVFARVTDPQTGQTSRLGLERRGRSFESRIDGEASPSMLEMFRRCAAVFAGPECGELITGPAELRRRFLDWSLFHVEPRFLPVWRRFQRVTQQRNTLLRRGRFGPELTSWTEEFIDAGAQLHELRNALVARLSERVSAEASSLLPGLGAVQFSYRPGWKAVGATLVLADAVAAAADSDARLGYSTVGPQRAGWVLSFERLTQREMYSRGQAKLAALAMLLAQIGDFSDQRAQVPIVALDDVMAEIDAANRARILQRLRGLGAQVFLTAVESGAEQTLAADDALFHVEQGVVTRRV